MSTKISKVILVSRPKGEPTEDNFKVIQDEAPKISGQNQLLARTLYLSVDPYMRERMKESGASFASAWKLNDVPTGGAVGEVLESNSSDIKKGDLIYSESYPFQTIALLNLDKQDVEVLPKDLKHPSYALSILGMPGMTAYCGFTDICKPKEGETVVITAAAGAVGSTVGQIGKLLGCRVIGITGSSEKLKTIKELGFDEGINYKEHKEDLSKTIEKLCPKGVDCFYDNVGGPIMDAVMENLALHARVAICGAISQYHGQHIIGPRHNEIILSKSALVKGFVVLRDYAQKKDEAMKQLKEWLQQNKIKMHETNVDGIENLPKAFVNLFRGENVGKMIVTINKMKESE